MKYVGEEWEESYPLTHGEVKLQAQESYLLTLVEKGSLYIKKIPNHWLNPDITYLLINLKNTQVSTTNLWRNGNALDSRPKDWGFRLPLGSFCYRWVNARLGSQCNGGESMEGWRVNARLGSRCKVGESMQGLGVPAIALTPQHCFDSPTLHWLPNLALTPKPCIALLKQICIYRPKPSQFKREMCEQLVKAWLVKMKWSAQSIPCDMWVRCVQTKITLAERLELPTYRLTAGRATNCATQDILFYF